ncbi:glycosyl transferase group 1 [Thermobispora bispora DSM 43833]|uniref:Glycosyl transferase group 1 n=2 Tax=Thermobispora bispora TaxID=2006 RepID=D6Y6R3_THEBD|nr:glycosyl transferase group 1 [Thermobispora bispora DSM 43833]
MTTSSGGRKRSAHERLHIAMVAPPWYDIPPKAYGGIESMVADLTQGLRRRGHEVTLIGAGDGVDHRTYETPPSSRIGEPLPEVLHAARVNRLLEELDPDVIHDHSLAGPLSAGGRSAPTVVTCHGDVTGELGDVYRAMGKAISLVAISWAQRANAPDLNWVGRVHNAVDVSTFPYTERKEDWVLWIGRFNMTKGAHLAIEAARAAGRRIVLAGKLTEEIEHAYFNEYVRPLLGPDAEYVGEADATLKRELYAKARCLVFPLQWEEPFGMVMIESMACGTPVVALNRGSVPEVVANGVTGYVCEDLAEIPAKIEAVDELDPRAIRAHVEANFDVSVMVEGYERIYQKVAARAPIRPSRRTLPLAR